MSVDCSLAAQSRKDGQKRCAYGRSLDGIPAPSILVVLQS